MTPGGLVRWLPDEGKYQAARHGTGHGPVPALLPAVPWKAALWRRVVDQQFAGHAPATPGGRAVIAWGGQGAAPAEVFSAWSGSRLARYAAGQPVEVEQAIAAAPEDSVLVVAGASLLTVAALARLTAAAAAAGKLLGVLSGRGPAELSFAVAKALLEPSAGLTAVDLLDAPSHRAAANLARLPAGFDAAIERPALAKILRTHGEGGHAKLPGVVVCGLLDQAEFAGDPAAGCRREPRHCKRAASVRARVAFADELAAPHVAFVCCNGFNVAAELYPSPVSMALSFAEGWAASLIAPTRPLIAPDAMLALLHEGMTAGRPLGLLVRQLNELSAEIGQRDAFVLHGDPLASLPAPRPAGAGTAAVRGAGVPDRAAGAGSAVALGDLRDWLVRALAQAARGHRFLRSAQAWLGDAAGPALDPLQAAFRQVESLLLNALKWAETSPRGESLDQLLRSQVLARMAIGRADRALLQLMTGNRETLDAFDLGHYDQIRVGIEPGGGCLRCGTPTEVHRYGRDEAASDQRLAEFCWVCGPISEGRARGPRIRVTASPPAAAAGDQFTLRARLEVPGPSPVSAVARLSLRCYDKASGDCVHEAATVVPARGQAVVFSFLLPPGLSADLHSVHLAAACGLDIAYARARFAGLPPGASHRSGGGLAGISVDLVREDRPGPLCQPPASS